VANQSLIPEKSETTKAAQPDGRSSGGNALIEKTRPEAAMAERALLSDLPSLGQ
jgi:hypothetical protein